MDGLSALPTRLSSLLAGFIISEVDGIVNSIEIHPRFRYNILVRILAKGERL